MSSNLLGNSSMPNYIKLAAIGIISLTYCAALGIATRDYLTGIPVPTDVATILGACVGMAFSVLGFHQGTTTITNGGTSNASPPAA